MILNRRRFLGIMAGAIAAPIVVRSGLLMPVRPRLAYLPTWYDLEPPAKMLFPVVTPLRGYDDWLARTIVAAFQMPAYIGPATISRAKVIRWDRDHGPLR